MGALNVHIFTINCEITVKKQVQKVFNGYVSFGSRQTIC